MNTIENEQPQTDDTNAYTGSGDLTGEPAKITVLEGNKVLFDDKVGLSPVQVVEKTDQTKSGGNGQENP